MKYLIPIRKFEVEDVGFQHTDDAENPAYTLIICGPPTHIQWPPTVFMPT
jgi:hypothetical protein